jgi:hypothetical protein
MSMPLKSLSAVAIVIAIAIAILLFYGSNVISDPTDETNQEDFKARLGMNLAGPADWSTEYAFVDMFLLSRKWVSNCHNREYGKGPELKRDENGWVEELKPNCFAETYILTNNNGHAPFGDYTCLYEGKGQISFKSSQVIPPLQEGKMTINITSKDSTIIQLLKTDPNHYLRNIRLIIPGYENTYETHPFYPPFLERWQSFDTAIIPKKAYR